MDFRKIIKYQIPWKLVQWERSCSMRKDRRTDMSKLIAEFRNFAEAHNNEISLWGIFVFDIVLAIQSEKLYKKAKEDTGIWNRSIRKRS
jgi:hypothetical protein